jgi:urease accessory protein
MSAYPIAASAHVGIGDNHDLLHGFLHPLSGIDHLLAMVAVGMFAAYLGGRARWLVPLAFVSVMAAAGWGAMMGLRLPLVELGIGLSVIVLGAVIALRVKLPTAAAMALVGFFAIFHGHAHGAEMAGNANALAYGIGFLSATALLHGLGIVLGMELTRIGEARSWRLVQAGGGVIALTGVAIVAGIF